MHPHPYHRQSRHPAHRVVLAAVTTVLVLLGATAASADPQVPTDETPQEPVEVRSTGVGEHHGDAALNRSVVHPVTVSTPGPLRITVSWPTSSHQLRVTLRAPGSSKAVRTASTGSPIVLEHEATQPGTWTVRVESLTGAGPYRLAVEVEGPDAPLPPLPDTRQPYDTPASSWQAVGRVRAIVPLGEQLWLGGHFRSVASPGVATGSGETMVRERLAVLDRTTGTPLPIAPVFDGHVWAMAASVDGSTIYVAGAFRTVDGVSRNRLAALDTSTGALLPWNPGANSIVRTLAVTPDGTRVLAGGQFTSLDSRAQRYLAAIDPGTGRIQKDFAPVVAQVEGPCPPRCSPTLDSLAFGADDTLYFGGHFGLVNGEPRNNAGAIALSAPTVALPWAPDVFTPDPNNPNQKNLVASIAVPPAGSGFEDRVILCGDWFRVAGVASPNVEAVDAVTGVPVPGWTASTDGGTPACSADATTVYIGGHFTKAGGAIAKNDGEARSHIAALHLADGRLLPWNPGVNSALGVHRLVLHEDRLFVGGDFTKAANLLQRGVATFLLRPPPGSAT